MTVAGALVRVFRDLLDSLRNLSFRWLFGGMLNVYAVGGVNAALSLYMLNYFWEVGAAGIMLVVVAAPAGAMLGAFLAPAVFERWSKRAGLIFGTLGWAFWQTLPVVLRLLGVFPENGDALLLPLLVGMQVVQGVCVAQADVGFGSMVADVVDEQEFDSGKRQEGMFFASTYFAGKASSGIGAIVAGVALDLISWPRGAHIETAADIPAGTIVDLGVIYGPMVAGFGFASVWCFSRYRLTRQRHAEILMVLARRRAGGSGVPHTAQPSEEAAWK